MEDVVIFNVHFLYFTAKYGTFWGYLVYFSPFWNVVPRKIGMATLL
jgi:hypothetical protein